MSGIRRCTDEDCPFTGNADEANFHTFSTDHSCIEGLTIEQKRARNEALDRADAREGRICPDCGGCPCICDPEEVDPRT